MPASDYLEGSDEPTTTTDDEPSSTYIEFNSRDHPTAHSAASDKGTIRSAFSGRGGASVHDFYAALTESLVPLFESGDKSEVLEFIEPSREEVEAYLDTLDEGDDDSEADDN